MSIFTFLTVLLEDRMGQNCIWYSPGIIAWPHPVHILPQIFIIHMLHTVQLVTFMLMKPKLLCMVHNLKNSP